MAQKTKRINISFTLHEYEVITGLGDYIGKSRSAVVHDIIEGIMPMLEQQLKLLNKARDVQERFNSGQLSPSAYKALENEMEAIRGRLESMQEQSHSTFSKMSDAMDSTEK